MKGGALRIGAFGIAALAVVDPSVTSSRSSRPIIAVVAPDSAATVALTNRVVQVLDRRFTVVRGAFDAAAATVVVGHALPDEWSSPTAPVLAVLPSELSPSVRLMSAEAPAVASVNALTPVHVTVAVRGSRGHRLIAQLRSGDAVVDADSQTVDIDSGHVELTLHHVSASSGARAVVVHASIDGTAAADSAISVVDTRDDRAAVLFHDARPSWSSTFVRRSLEQDPRFSVTYRVVTSRGLSNTGGEAPQSLRDAASLAGFATIVVGAPENLTISDIDALEGFMRRRGGRVVLLLDGTETSQIDRLTGVSNWRISRLSAVLTMPAVEGFGTLRGKETRWPATLPPGATVHADGAARDSTRLPVVWSVPVGAGRLMIGGALDAWQYRSDSSGFNSFWTYTIAQLSNGAPLAIAVDVYPRVLRPGETLRARIGLREPLLSNRASRSALVSAALVSDRDSVAVRLWPDRTPGVFLGTTVGPRRPGTYRLAVRSGADRAESFIVVDPGAGSPRYDERDVISAFASSRHGSVISEDDLRELPDRLSSAIQVVSRVETWHPMRSPWWIVPFALLLGAEWWWRRRRGLA